MLCLHQNMETLIPMRKILELELSEDSYFAKSYIQDRLASEATDKVPMLTIENAGIRFMALSRFHDAKILNIIDTEKYGKHCTILQIDFKATTTEFKNGYRKFDIHFTNAEYIEKPIRLRELHILNLDFVQESKKIITNMELAYFIGTQEHRVSCKIISDGIEVKPFNTR